ncbi:hypothetical protein GOB81_09795 [Acetobacter sp. LMG 1627]|uniref:Transposase n=1 Tax=Acetobacter conturbans TaxID=1737472 RepID=A0ABX0K3M0_9PROT|nr:hypothetical protein [Acetobacter conturbans]
MIACSAPPWITGSAGTATPLALEPILLKQNLITTETNRKYAADITYLWMSKV